MFVEFIFKVLANRLRMMLPLITFSLQSAFVSNKDIHCNFLVAHEILSTFSRTHSKRGYMVIKLDMEKSYNRLDWDFIKKCFEDLVSMRNGLTGSYNA